MSENRMTPPAEGQEKDVLLVLDKQQGKVSAVKGFDKEGNLQTVRRYRAASSCRWTGTATSSATLSPISTASFRTPKGWHCSAARHRRWNKTQRLSRTTTATPRRRATNRWKHSVYRNRTTRNPSRATASTRRRLIGKA